MAEPMRTGPWTPPDSFAFRLRQVRLDLGLTVEQIAARCGLNDKTWSSWENGSRPQKLAEVVATVAAVTGVDPIWLMWGARNPSDLPEPQQPWDHVFAGQAA